MNYLIRSGDTLSAPARRFKTSVSRIAEQNGIRNVQLIFAGKRLAVSGQSCARTDRDAFDPGRARRPTPGPGPTDSPRSPGVASPSRRSAPDRAAPAPASGVRISAGARRQMDNLVRVAQRSAHGRRPMGWCLREVQNYLGRTRYGSAHQLPRFPFARNFGEYLNRGSNAERHGLRRLNLTNPYKAPPGAIIVVRAGTPGTRHPTAGDIVVKGPGSTFYNDGMMGYGGPRNFPPGNRHVIGIYVPRQVPTGRPEAP